MAENVIDLPELELLCPRCAGEGGETELGKWHDCIECGGAGYIPTRAGSQLLALMRHNFKPMLEQVTNE